MGVCKYCGQNAGFLKDHHKACYESYKKKEIQEKAASEDVVRTITTYVKGDMDLSALKTELANKAHEHKIAKESMKDLFIQGWKITVNGFLEDGIISEAEEKKITDGAKTLGLDLEELKNTDVWLLLTMGCIIRDVLEGRKPDRFHIENTPFNLQKNESLIWAFPNVEYHEQKIVREYVGGSAGISIRIMKGVYYRTSAFKGNPVERDVLQYKDKGWLGITDKNLYFVGDSKSMRVPYKKIINYKEYSDGIGIHRDAASAKPQIFITHFGWFTFNLVKNLAAMETG